MLVGKRIGPFELTEELGSGAMGTVYKALYNDNGRQRTVALKIIALGLSGNENALARFEREANILKQLKHPNIVRLFASGRYKGTPFFAMEFVDGESLEKRLARQGRFGWEEVIHIGKQVAEALHHAHEKGIIHRDLKPSNLMVLSDGTIKLTDFGIAKDMDVTALTGANCTVGTAAYMSPEQCKGTTITAKSDLYALGVVLFELLTGRKPFQAESPVDMFMLHVNEPAPRVARQVPDVPVWLDTLICQLMEKKPEHRPRDAEMVCDALDEIVEKVGGGKSAGVDAVQARVVDRRIQTMIPDETDREAARALRVAVTGKKGRKKKSRPWFERPWAKAIPILVALSLIPFGIMYILKPPTADELYLRASKAMESEDKYGAALERMDGKDGPIREFLSRYPDDARASQVAEWRDKAETHKPLKALQTRMRAAKKIGRDFRAESEFEDVAVQALRFEEFGDLVYAWRRWVEAAQLAEKDTEHPERKKLAERRKSEIDAKWNELKKKTDKNLDEKTFRASLLEQKLEEARKLVKTERKTAREICEEIADLYRREDDKDLKKIIDEFEKLRKNIG